jgi:hypothetical protein
MNILFLKSVLRIRIRDPVLFDRWIRDPDLGLGKEKIRIRNIHLGSYFRKFSKKFLG